MGHDTLGILYNITSILGHTVFSRSLAHLLGFDILYVKEVLSNFHGISLNKKIDRPVWTYGSKNTIR